MSRYFITTLIVLVLFSSRVLIPCQAQEQDEEALRKASQNPVADIVSLPLQNNILFGVGPEDETANVLNIQPVIPINIGNWNLINRTIIPVIYLPEATVGLPELPEGGKGGAFEIGSEFGLGDINHTVFLSPAKPGKIIWGIGPSITLDTATDDLLGTGKWSIGPSAVVLTMPTPWVLGVLVRQLWSFAGDSDRNDVSQFLTQVFVNYNLPKGWYLTSSPVITANWEADNDERWTVPVGGGVGRLFRLGKLPINAQVQGFYNVERPEFGPDWSLRFQWTFLLPKLW